MLEQLGPPAVRLVEELDGIDALEAVQYHQDTELRTRSSALVDRFYGEDYGLEEEFGQADTVQGAELGSGGQFTFDAGEMPPWRKG
eukprot:SAG31_NODE_909_length_11079_cov_176.706102_3_plen_86_part_00